MTMLKHRGGILVGNYTLGCCQLLVSDEFLLPLTVAAPRDELRPQPQGAGVAAHRDTYQDAMGILYRKLIERGARGNIGFTSTDGHDFEVSDALIDGKFCGLAIDEEQQPDLTEARVLDWAEQIKKELADFLVEASS